MTADSSIIEALLQQQEMIRRVCGRACRKYNLDPSWVDDLAQQVCLDVLEGNMGSIEPKEVFYRLRPMIRNWLRPVLKESTIVSYVKSTSVQPPSPYKLYQLQELWDLCFPSEQRAIASLILEGKFASGEASRAKITTRANALQRLRKRLEAA